MVAPALPSSPSSPFQGTAWDEKSYQRWLCERQLPVNLQVFGFIAFTIVGFGAWDAWLSGSSVLQTWPIRLLALAFVGLCAMLLRFTGVVNHWRALSLISSCTLLSLLLLILVRLPEGSALGSGGLLLSAFLLRVHSPRMAMFAALFNALALAGVYSFFGVEQRLIINTEIFLLMASVGNIILNSADDRGDRQKFGFEWKLRRLATTDGLTGASNRRYFSDKLGEEVERGNRYGHPLTLILFDLDRFKAVNDSRGHGDGDHALRAVAAIGIERGRASDTFARIGGEEFVMLLPHTELDAGLAFAERLRDRIESQVIQGEGGHFSVTSSFGVASLKRQETGDTLVARADTALYLAKNLGRNRVASQRDLQLHTEPTVAS